MIGIPWGREKVLEDSSIKPSEKLSLQKVADIVFIDLEELKEHEEIRPDYLEELKNEIVSDGILKMPIAVDKNTLHYLRRASSTTCFEKNRL